jgi:hypothetical protein
MTGTDLLCLHSKSIPVIFEPPCISDSYEHTNDIWCTSIIILSFKGCIGSVCLRLQSSSGLLSTRHKFQFSGRPKWGHFIDHIITVNSEEEFEFNPQQLSVLTEFPWFKRSQIENSKKYFCDSTSQVLCYLKMLRLYIVGDILMSIQD